MSERDFVFENCRMSFRRNVNYRAVLNVRALADADVINVAAQNRTEPNARFRADFDIADDNRIVGDKCRFVNFRMFVLKRFNHNFTGENIKILSFVTVRVKLIVSNFTQTKEINLMAKKPKILAFAGSLREHSFSKRVVKTAMKGAIDAGADVTFIDLRDYPMPIYNEDDHQAEGFSENALAFQKILGEHDGFLICSPEYNASLPAALKNAIDWASRKSEEYAMIEVFKGKVAAIMTESPGAFGGIRCLGHLRTILSVMLVNVLPSEIAVSGVSKLYDGSGEEMTDEKMRGILEELGKSLADMLRKTHGEIEVVEELAQ